MKRSWRWYLSINATNRPSIMRAYRGNRRRRIAACRAFTSARRMHPSQSLHKRRV